MELGMPLDETVNGLNYKDRTFMVAGYLKDYKLTYEDIIGELDESKKELTVADFKENRGYVDNDGYVWIYRETPKKTEKLPWFTVEADPDAGKPKLVFNPVRTGYEKSDFYISRVGDWTAKAIIDDTTDKPVEYDESVLTSIARATSVVSPTIEPTDDFLKKLVKQAIISKHVNVKKYNVKVPKSYYLSNLINGLTNTTKTGPLTFLQWMELLDCDFEIKVFDNGGDRDDPLPEPITYNSVKDKIIIGEDGDDDVPSDKMARSVKI